MTKIIGYSVKESKEGKQFVNLELQGDIVLVQSQQNNRYYAPVKKAFINSTFDEETAKQFVGKEISGRIEKVDCLEYDYTIPATGEVIKLSHRMNLFLQENLPL